MLRSAAITIIKRGLGFRQTQDSAIIAALQQVQRDLEQGKSLPDWLLTYDAALPVTANVPYVALPTGFLRFHEDYPLYYVVTGTPVVVPRRRNDEARAAYTASTASYPSVAVLQKSDIALIPTPTKATTLFLTYYKAAQVLDSELENAWLANAANYLIGLAGMQVAGDLRDAGALQKFTTMAKMGSQSYLGDIVDNELAGRSLVMGRDN